MPNLRDGPHAQGSSRRLFDALAADYETHFGEPHRRAYDDLAWELVVPMLPSRAGLVIDAGCGTGRWARRLLALGHAVVGIEPAPKMAARAAELCGDPRFELRRATIEDARLSPGCADVVIAMGSLQYTPDPAVALARLADWTRPGGTLCVLVDSLVALAVELLAAGRDSEADMRLRTRHGAWNQRGEVANLHLFDRAELERLFEGAGLDVTHTAGLLVGATVFGRDELRVRLMSDYARQLAEERRLSRRPELADLGKQLFVAGRRAPSRRT